MFFFRNIPYVEENIVEPERLLVLAAAGLVVSHALFLSTTTEDQYKALAWLQINGLWSNYFWCFTGKNGLWCLSISYMLQSMYYYRMTP
jgi:hypothetical protein